MTWGRVAIGVAALCLAPAPLFAQGALAPAEERRMERERATTGVKSDWEREQEAREFREGDLAFPAAPSDGLVEFFVSSASNFRFYVDRKSLSVDADGVVRYTLVARSPAGAETVSYEGMRCGGQGMVRVYGFAHGGKWTSNPRADWRVIEPKSVQRWHNELRGRYWCPNRISIATAAEGLDALRRGGHPAIANTGHGQ